MGALDTCCFCFSVKTGSYIIGYYNVIVCALGVLGGIGMAIYGAVIKNQEIDGYNRDYSHTTQIQMQMQMGNTLVLVGLVLLVVLAIGLTISTLFVVGLHKNKRAYVKVFMICMILSLVSSGLSTLATFVSLIPQAIVSSLIGLAIQVYFFLVVKSHYDNMGSANEGVTYSFNKSQQA